MSVVFGRVSKGIDIVKRLSNLETESNRIKIVNCGEIGYIVDLPKEPESNTTDPNPNQSVPRYFDIAANLNSIFNIFLIHIQIDY